MKHSLIPSPARSQGSRTPRRHRTRRTLSTGSGASVRLTALLQDNMGSFVLSPPVTRRSILTDNTDIEEPKRKSWWKNLGENSRDVIEVLTSNNDVEPNNIIEELDMEILSQEKKNYNVDLPDSSCSESIDSIVIPQRKLFTQQKENQQQNKYDKILTNRQSATKPDKPNTTNANETLTLKSRDLFQHNKPRSRPIFPAALLEMSLNKTAADKTKDIIIEPKVRNIFGKAPSKRKNMFANFIVSESDDDDISDIQPKVFGFAKKDGKRRNSKGMRIRSSTSSIASNNEMDDWRCLPSSTMVENQIEAAMSEANTPKRAKLSNVLNIDTDKDGDENEFTLVYEDEPIQNDQDEEKANITLTDVNKSKQNEVLNKSKQNISLKSNKSKNKNEDTQNAQTELKIQECLGKEQNDIKISEIMKQEQSDIDNGLQESVAGNVNTSVPQPPKVSHDTTGRNRSKQESPVDIPMEQVNEIQAEQSDDSENEEINESKQVEVSESQEIENSNDKDEASVSQEDKNQDNEDDGEANVSDNEDNEQVLLNSEQECDSENEQSDNEVQNESNAEQVDNQEESAKENEQSDNEIQNKSDAAQIEEQQEWDKENEQSDNEVQNESDAEQILDQEESDKENELSDDEVQNESETEQFEEQQESDKENDQSDDEVQNESETEQIVDQEESDKENEQSDNDVQNESDTEQFEEQEESDNENEQQQSADNVDTSVTETPNVSHDTTGRNRSKHESPEVVLRNGNGNNANDSFTVTGKKSYVRKTSIMKDLSIRPIPAPDRDSIGLSDGTKNSSAEGSGWDSHRTTRKTIRQTFGKGFTPRKSLRALVMEQSAKRQTLNRKTITSATPQLPIANSTELHEISNYHDAPEPLESELEVSTRTRQTKIEAYLLEIRNKNMERIAHIEEAVRNSLNSKPQQHNFFKVPAVPAFPRKQTKVQKPKSQSKRAVQLDGLPEELIADLNYKPPKRYKPPNSSWVTKRLYKFLETKLEPRYDYKARVRAEKLVESIFTFTKDMRRRSVASPDAVEVLKQEMARLRIVKTHYDFYEFFHQYMPREVIVKVVPDVTNKISVPKEGVFSDIL